METIKRSVFRYHVRRAMGQRRREQALAQEIARLQQVIAEMQLRIDALAN